MSARNSSHARAREPAGAARPRPLLPGTNLPRGFGLMLTVGVILVLELTHEVGLPLPVPAGVLLLVVAVASYLEGTGRGLVAAAAAVGYQVYAFLQHGSALLDPSWPPLRLGALALVTLAVVGMVAVFRSQLDHLLRKERDALQQAERDRLELSEALEQVERAQETLRLQANLLTAVAQGVVATDVSGRITWWNEPAARLFGRSAAEAVTRPITQVIPDPASSPEATLARIGRGEPWAGEVEVERPDGERVTVLLSDSPIRDGAGRCTGMVRVVTDLTAQKEAERRQRLLADSGSALAASLDYESTIRSVARLCVPAFADGCAVDLVEADGTAWRIEAAHADPAVAETVRGARRRFPLHLDSDDPVAGVIRTGLPVIATNITETQLARFARDAEHLDWLRGRDLDCVVIVPLRAAGRTLGAMTFWRGRDTPPFRESDLVLAEEIASRSATAIQQARLFETALAASKAKSDFLAVMSHELRTPLTTIVGYADLMLGGVPQSLPEQAATYIGRIRQAAGQLLGVIEQILIYARLETGREEVRPDRIAVAQLLRETATLIDPVAQEKDIGFSVELPPPDVVIETDAMKLRQILLNLLSNAVKFTDRGNVRLAARADEERVTISVSDTGIGIAEENIERVFEPFWQVDQSPTRRVGGAGLGLAVARRLASWLGGEIRAESEHGRGTTFRVELPLRWHGSDDGAGADRTRPTAGGAGSAGSGQDVAVDPAAARH